MGLKWLVFKIGPLYLVGMWFNEDRIANTMKTHVYKRLGYVFEYYQLIDIIGKINVFR